MFLLEWKSCKDLYKGCNEERKRKGMTTEQENEMLCLML